MAIKVMDTTEAAELSLFELLFELLFEPLVSSSKMRSLSSPCSIVYVPFAAKLSGETAKLDTRPLLSYTKVTVVKVEAESGKRSTTLADSQSSLVLNKITVLDAATA